MLRWSLVFLLFVQSAKAGTPQPLVMSPSASRSEYETYVAIEVGYKNYSEYQIDQLDKLPKINELNQRLKAAQTSYLKGSLSEAQKNFMKLIALDRKADWARPQRKALFSAYLRLAQLSTKDNERQRWLKKAAEYSWDLKPDARLFPPPLLREFKKVQSLLTWVTVRPHASWSQFRYLLINGIRYPLQDHPELRLPLGQHRLTWISDSHETLTHTLKAREVNRLSLSARPLAKGSCKSPEYRTEHMVFFGSNCVQNSKSIKNFLPDRKPSSSPLQRASLPVSSDSKGKKSWLQSPWLWVGVTAVVATMAYSAQQNQKGDPPRTIPTRKDGF